jgi:signal peptidase I
MTKKKLFHELRILAVMILIVTSLRSALADWNDVPSGSMKPTIEIGDRVVVNKLAYDLKIPFTTIEVAKWGDPKRGDIVVLFSPQNGTRLVKRVVAIPGDTISMEANELFVNGSAARWKPIGTPDSTS